MLIDMSNRCIFVISPVHPAGQRDRNFYLGHGAHIFHTGQQAKLKGRMMSCCHFILFLVAMTLTEGRTVIGKQSQLGSFLGTLLN